MRQPGLFGEEAPASIDELSLKVADWVEESGHASLEEITSRFGLAPWLAEEITTALVMSDSFEWAEIEV